MGLRFATALLALAMVGAACSDAEQLQSGTVQDAGVDEAMAGPEGTDDAARDDDSADTTTDGDAATEESDDDSSDADSDGNSDPDDDPDEGSESGGSDSAEDSESDDQDAEDEDADAKTDDTDDQDSDDEEEADDDSADADGDGTAAQPTVEPVELTISAAGDSGDHVLALQEQLDVLGFGPGTPDGSYGKKTTKAVVAFQRLLGLNETGTADARTLAALKTYEYTGLLLVSGDEGDVVEALQEKLADGPFDPGPIDGVYGTGTTQAVWALEKLADIPVDGDWGPLDERAWELLLAGAIGEPENTHDQRWVEVDLSKQIMKVYDPGSTTPTLISHASSGSGVPWSNEEFSGSSNTPLGDFHINRRVNGWRESSLNIGRLYNPLYFNGGIAFHGATSVPLYPASHGCIRLPMHVADYLPGELPNGTPVHVLRS